MSKAYHVEACRATSEARMASQAQRADLGTFGRSSSALAAPSVMTSDCVEQLLRTRYTLRDRAATLMPDEAVARCGLHLAPNSGGVAVQYTPSNASSHFSGLEACHSVWMCPCCAAKISERRRAELTLALREARKRHMRVVMCTFTFEHHRGQNLERMLGKMRRAWKLYTSGRRADALNKAFTPVGSIRALEVTYSDDNGWHPHIHQLVILPAGARVGAYASAARMFWEEAAFVAGLAMNEHGFEMVDCDDKIAAYVTKFGRDPSDETQRAWEQGWTEANELTKWHTKLGRDAKGKAEHVTPMQLLQYAELGDERAGQLFREYARAFKGQRQLYWSPRLKKLFGIEEKTDQEIADEQTADAERLAFLRIEEWQVVVKKRVRVDLLMVARTGLAWKVCDFLYSLDKVKMARFAPGGAGTMLGAA